MANYLHSAIPLLVCIVAVVIVVPAGGQVSVVNDDFETGFFSVDWDVTEGFSTSIIGDPNSAAADSDHYARIQGVTGDGSEAGLGVSLYDLDGNATTASDFAISLDFRIDSIQPNKRMFNLMVNSTSNSPTPTGSTLNLRYYNDTWEAYNGSWQTVPLPAISPNSWHSITVTGNNWGSGVTGTATWDVQLNGGTTLAGLQLFQNNADANGARSVSINDRWDGTGFDVDNVTINATPGAVSNNTIMITPTNPVAYSGIYPHTAVANTHNEAAVGALLKRGDKVWFVTYGPHVTTGGSDELYSVDTTTLEHTTWLDYPGNTDANRYTDTSLGIEVVGAAYFDSSDTVRYLPVTSPSAGHMVGRLTGTAAHLTDSNKLYFMTMEEGLYEVDFSNVSNPVITTLRVDGNHGGSRNLPGVHGKGLFTGQGQLLFTNNGAGGGAKGGLVEWDGTGDPEQLSSWTVVDDTAQYTEVTSRQGPVDMDPSSTDAIWATGWDEESMFINTRDAATGTWTKFRLPKSSYTHGHPNGWYTEWPRIRDVGLAGGYLMSHHGMMFLVPETFSADSYGGVLPLTTHHKMIVDYVEHGSQIIMAGNDSTKFNNSLVPKANSNIQFVEKDQLNGYGGNPRGFGGVWVDQAISANMESDAFLVNGFKNRVVHFAHDSKSSVNYTIEIDPNGDGNWTPHTIINVPGSNSINRGYGFYILPETLDAEWVRFRSDQNLASSTVYLHQGNDDKAADASQFSSLATTSASTPRSQGLIRSMSGSDFKLEFAADRLDSSGNVIDTGYYQAQLNPMTAALEIVAVSDAPAEAALRAEAATTQDFGVDAASVFIDDGGTRYRLPKGDPSFDVETASGWRRGVREVVTERELMNIHGTFYELPRDFTGGGIERIVPITTHNLDIFDFASWRGMLVLSGVVEGGAHDGHYLESDDGRVGLWFGNVDDLWSFGAPAGVGGPWKDTAVSAGVASDPYLMAGYNDKVLQLSHDEESTVSFTVEVDFLGTNEWHIYDTLSVEPGEVLTHVFEAGYSAHWVRLTSDTSTKATSWFIYGENPVLLDPDFDSDGRVSGLDLLRWQREVGSAGQIDNANGDASGNGIVDSFDLTLWEARYGERSPQLATACTVPEPGSIMILSSSYLLTSLLRSLAHLRLAG